MLDGLAEQGMQGLLLGAGERREDLILHAEQRPVQVCEKLLTPRDSAMIARRRAQAAASAVSITQRSRRSP